MTRENEILQIRELLQQRRHALLQTAMSEVVEHAALKSAERGREMEEQSQVEQADDTLLRLVETQRRELTAIDAALKRAEEGSFGICVDCEEPIPTSRLNALPFALRCEEDEEAHEEQERRATSEARPN